MIVSKLYKQLNEGAISQSNFLQQVRRDPVMKSLGINNLMSFSDTIKLLKNKRAITENYDFNKAELDHFDASQLEGDTVQSVIDELEQRFAGHPTEHDVVQFLAGTSLSDDEANEVELYFINQNGLDEELDEDSTAAIPDLAANGLEPYVRSIRASFKKKYDLDDTLINMLIRKYPKLIKMGFSSGDSPEYTAENIMTMDEIEVPELNETNPLFEGKIAMTLDRANPGEVRIGLNTEMEKGKDCDAALKIVLKNLDKDPLFYTNAIAGFDIKKRTDQMVPVDKKMSNTVDKANGVDVVEKIEKGDSAKETNEEVKPVSGVKQDTQQPKAAKGVQKMEVPGKEKTIKEALKKMVKRIILEEIQNYKNG